MSNEADKILVNSYIGEMNMGCEELTDIESRKKLKKEIGKRITIIRNDMKKQEFAKIIRNKTVVFNFSRKG